MRSVLLICGILAALPALAQTATGSDGWVVEYYRPYGSWNVVCDQRVTGETTEQRCYIRHVEVLSPGTNGISQSVVVRPGPEIELMLKGGASFEENGLRIDGAGGAIWTTNRFDCIFSFACTFSGEEAKTLLNAMAGGTAFAFDFTDRNGTQHVLRWDLASFSRAVDELETETKRRGL